MTFILASKVPRLPVTQITFDATTLFEDVCHGGVLEFIAIDIPKPLPKKMFGNRFVVV